MVRIKIAKAARKCWICDIAKFKPPLTIEILGTIVDLSEKEMQVEDGTGSITVIFEGQDVKGTVGELVNSTLLYEQVENNDPTFVAEIITWKISLQTENLFQWRLLSSPGSFGYPFLPFNKHHVLRYIKHAGCGVLLEDLAFVIEKSNDCLLPFIHELQNDGSIYQNGKGEYVLL